MVTKIHFDNKNIYVSYDNGEYIVNKLDNAWLWLIGAINEETPIEIKDQREHLEDHQYNLSCKKNVK